MADDGPGDDDLERPDSSLLLEALGHAVMASDLDGRITYWNDAARAFYGWAAEDVLGRQMTEVVLPGFDQAATDDAQQRLSLGRPWRGALTVQRRDGTTFTALMTADPVRDDAGQVVGVVTVSTNIGALLRPLLQQSQEAAVVTTVDGVVRYASPAAERVLAWSDAELAGHSLLELVHPDDRADVVRWAGESGQDPSAPVEFRLRTARGTWRWVEGLLADLADDPSVGGLVWTLRDTSERRTALDRMTDAALHDPLTGLPNRLLLADRLAQATARRQRHGAVLFLDLDGFKAVNDALGHAAGDELLRVVGDRLRRAVRPEDTCGRWSGDEFLVLNEEVTTLTDARLLAERIERALGEPVEVAGRRLHPRVSIGVAVLDGLPDPEAVLRAADADMYRVKQQHRTAARGTTLR